MPRSFGQLGGLGGRLSLLGSIQVDACSRDRLGPDAHRLAAVALALVTCVLLAQGLRCQPLLQLLGLLYLAACSHLQVLNGQVHNLQPQVGLLDRV